MERHWVAFWGDTIAPRNLKENVPPGWRKSCRPEAGDYTLGKKKPLPTIASPLADFYLTWMCSIPLSIHSTGSTTPSSPHSQQFHHH